MSPEEYCQQKAAQSGSSFYYSFPVFCRRNAEGPSRRFMRFAARWTMPWTSAGDDAIAHTKLSVVAQGNQCHAARQSHASGDQGIAALPCAVCLGRQTFHGHYRRHGNGFDPDALPGFPRSATLLLACRQRGRHHVGQHIRRIKPETLLYAEKLGLAFQLTNIISRRRRRRAQSRIYLPVNELQQFNVTAADILNARHNENFENLMRFQAQRAQKCMTTPSRYCRKKIVARSGRGSSWRRFTGPCWSKSNVTVFMYSISAFP